jgi:DNA-binding PadR family transcriptional regulator
MELDERYLSVLKALEGSPKTGQELTEQCRLGEKTQGAAALGILNKYGVIAKVSIYILTARGEAELRRRGQREELKQKFTKPQAASRSSLDEPGRSVPGRQIHPVFETPTISGDDLFA